jgi:hypothetical protein
MPVKSLLVAAAVAVVCLIAALGPADALSFRGGQCVEGCEFQDARFVTSVDPACESITNEIRRTLCATEDNGGSSDDAGDADNDV